MNKKITKNTLVIVLAGIGMLLSTLDTGIINVALPFLQKEFATTTSIAALSAISYTMSLAIFILPFGYASDRFGKLKVSYWGLVLFGIGSVLCGMSSNIIALIIFRVLQGIGAAALQATSAALITTLIDAKHISNALGVLGIMIGLGPVLGPSVGGFFLALNLWRFLFWINLPFIVIGLICNRQLIRTSSEKTKKVKFDLFGSITSALLIISLLTGFSLLSNYVYFIWSFSLFIISLLLGWLLYSVETKQDAPLIDFGSLQNDLHSWLYLGQTIIFGFASAMIFLLPPFIFEKVLGFNVGLTGLLVLGAPAGLVIFSRISGKLNNGHQNQFFSLIGLIIITFSLAGLLFVNQYWSALIVTFLLFVYGIGGGFFQPANIAVIMQLGNQRSQGSIGSLQRMVQNVAIASGTAVGAAILNLFPRGLISSIRINFGITLILAIIIVSLTIAFSSMPQRHIFYKKD
ncbi:MFS transporter [Liquorilactobacillus capillatus]|uniref:Mepa n=1 Tax=Liquorilactobacillus capillatus DSM 19910 TaxID=1423731 RepID=A0A0R1MCL6_9LACO|nr:MFS transporter [Liquorilactobacillus capillatus]KRL01144.1 mepa [Liquorilactobacillus capillatus DSM 19910]